MSTYGYEIPHDKIECVADKIKVQMPFPPKRIGRILTPDIWRDLSQHGHQMGIVRSAGPLAFVYKDGESTQKHKINIGDWVMFKWGAGTMFQPQRGIVVSGGWRYLSSFNDVVGWCKPEDMPDPSTLCWDDTSDDIGPMQMDQQPQNHTAVSTLPEGVRERVTYGSGDRDA